MLPYVFIIEIISNRPVKRRSGPRIIWFLFLTLTQTWIINSIATFMIKLWNKRGVSNFFPHLEKCNQYNFYSNNNNKYIVVYVFYIQDVQKVPENLDMFWIDWDIKIIIHTPNKPHLIFFMVESGLPHEACRGVPSHWSVISTKVKQMQIGKNVKMLLY